MGERSRNSTNRARRSTTAPASGTGGGSSSWADRLLLQPVLDDGRRSNSTKAPPGSPATGDRYIVGYNASGSWVALRGELVTWSGSAWVATATAPLVGSLVYSLKREEVLEFTDLSGATIAPALSPELLQLRTGTPSNIKFWLPQHLVDTLGNVIDQGKVLSRTTNYSSWVYEEYNRYIVPVGDPVASALAGYIGTLVTDQIGHTSYWVFHKPIEGALVYVDDTNAYYYYNGSTWQLFTSGGTGGPVGTLYAAEGRQGVAGLDATVLTASASNTYQKIAFAYSVISDTDICPLSFFTAAGTDFTVPRDGVYALGYSGFYITYTDPANPPDTISFSVKVNGTIVHEVTLPHVDDYEGEAWHGLKKLSIGDVVTFEFKTTGTHYNTKFTIRGFHGYVYTVDGGGTGGLVPHALGNHTDTVFGTPSLNDVVYWNGTKYVVGPVIATASPHQIISSSHSDSLAIGSITNGQFLQRISGKWSNHTLVLNDIANVIITSPALGQVVAYDGTNFVNTNIAATLYYDNLADVNMTGKVNGSVGRWNAGSNKYVPWTPVLSGLADVNTAGAVAGQALVFNGSAWVPGTVSATVSFAGGTYYFSAGNWNVEGAVQVNCGVSGIAFVAGVNGYWQLVITVVPNGAGSTFQLQWYVNTSQVSPVITGNCYPGCYQTFSATYGLGAGSSMKLVDLGSIFGPAATMTYLRATFTKVGN